MIGFNFLFSLLISFSVFAMNSDEIDALVLECMKRDNNRSSSYTDYLSDRDIHQTIASIFGHDDDEESEDESDEDSQEAELENIAPIVYEPNQYLYWFVSGQAAFSFMTRDSVLDVAKKFNANYGYPSIEEIDYWRGHASSRLIRSAIKLIKAAPAEDAAPTATAGPTATDIAYKLMNKQSRFTSSATHNLSVVSEQICYRQRACILSRTAK